MTDEAMPTTIPGVLARAAAKFADVEALVDDRARLSYRALHEAAGDVARGLVACGVAAGDRVGIWAPNSTEWVLAALGAYRAGAVIVPVNTRFKGREAAHALGLGRVRLLVTVTDFLGTNHVELLASAEPVPTLETTVVIDKPVEGTIAWQDLLARAGETDPTEIATRESRLTGSDPSDILFTSGTTGRPKGVMLAHGPSVRAYEQWSTVVGLREADRYLIVNPFFHGFGLKAGILACLLKGATIVPHAVFDVDEVLARVAQEHITMLPGAPTLYQSILDHPRVADFDLSSLRLGVTGAANVPVELVRRARAELGISMVTGYGLTEATGIATMCHHDDDPETIARTAGRAIEGVEVLVVDDDGSEVPRGNAGEVVIRGYNVMSGYADDPTATAEAIDADGWLHTGDVGVMDDAGNLRITDRLKDMFIVGGFNAYPAEIENIMTEHPAISQVAVIGMPDQRMGEVGCAFVVLRPGKDATPDDLVAWCRENMANYKVPRRVEIVAELPLNATGKVSKDDLRALVT